MKRKFVIIYITCIFTLLLNSTLKISVLRITLNNSMCKDSSYQINSHNSNDYDISPLDEWSRNFGEVKYIENNDNLLYLVGGDKELFIVNVSNPLNPKLVGSYSNNSEALTSEIKEDLLFLGLKENALEIINIKNKTNPERVGYYNTSGMVTDLYVKGDYIYLAEASSGIEVINIANISQPTSITDFYDGGSAEKIISINNFLFVADSIDGLEVYNISNPNVLQKIANFTDGNKIFDISIEENSAYILNDNDSMKILNISDFMNIKEIAEYYIEDPTNIVTKDNLTLITNDNKISVLNCTNPLYIEENTIFNATEEIITWSFEDNNIYLVEDEGIEIVEMNSNIIFNIKHRFGFGEINQMILSEEYLFTSMGTEGLAILDIREPTSISAIGEYNTSGKIDAIAKHSHFLYLAIQNKGIEIIDILNPKLPSKVGEFLTEGEAKAICIANEEYLFLADGSGGIKVYSLSNPEQLLLVNNFTERDDFVKIKFFDDTLFTITERGQVYLYNYSELIIPENDFSNCDYGFITEAGREFLDVVLKDKIVYLSTGTSLVIVDINDRNKFEQIWTLTDGHYYTLDCEGNLLFARGRSSVQLLDISNYNSIKQTELFVNNTFLTNIAVENDYLVVSNIVKGDDMLLYQLHYPDTQPSNTIWPYIVGPICGIVILVIAVFGIIKIRKKKTQ